MTDLTQILPSFRIAPFAALFPALERHGLSTTDLLASHAVDLAKVTRLPVLDLKRLVAAVQAELVRDVVGRRILEDEEEEEEEGMSGGGELASSSEAQEAAKEQEVASEQEAASETRKPSRTKESASNITTLDPLLDASLNGGIPLGCITEITGESGAGKTQLLLTLCLAIQLSGRKALYISTESALPTPRLAQILACNASLNAAHPRPSLDNILSTLVPDLESQDHILEYQVPVLLSRHDIGLVVLDSVAANYRAEFERPVPLSNMAARTHDLVRLGALLRNLARRHNMAVVVANQVADRFASSPVPPPSNPIAAAPPPGPDDLFDLHSMPALRLDHQQRWFTGWGDDPCFPDPLKTPSLGLVWATQISCRLVLLKRPVYNQPHRIAPPIDATAAAGPSQQDQDGLGEPTLKAWRRWLKVVFAPHAAASGPGLDGAVEFELTSGGPKALDKKSSTE
ncbi:hypothetical protein CDD81_6483 [Ophiocordyceps australis]|uniref:RecA family profile 1 domain-containing protein n=1 Tax=Ophiocordyceps australis TaxID=1399860 RepID=A0A2C5YG14_9HYPO|nr:hypothetical protein CDD81_6483 [Ophiocordyceps australis]